MLDSFSCHDVCKFEKVDLYIRLLMRIFLEGMHSSCFSTWIKYGSFKNVIEDLLSYEQLQESQTMS